MVAVVARENDNRLVREPEPVERVDHAAHLGIHEADAGVVGLERLPAQVVGHRVLLALVAHEGRRRDIGLILLHTLDDAHLLERVQVVVRLRRYVRRVGTEETDGEEEWPLRLAGAAL